MFARNCICWLIEPSLWQIWVMRWDHCSFMSPPVQEIWWTSTTCHKKGTQHWNKCCQETGFMQLLQWACKNAAFSTTNVITSVWGYDIELREIQLVFHAENSGGLNITWAFFIPVKLKQELKLLSCPLSHINIASKLLASSRADDPCALGNSLETQVERLQKAWLVSLFTLCSLSIMQPLESDFRVELSHIPPSPPGACDVFMISSDADIWKSSGSSGSTLFDISPSSYRTVMPVLVWLAHVTPPVKVFYL